MSKIFGRMILLIGAAVGFVALSVTAQAAHIVPASGKYAPVANNVQTVAFKKSYDGTRHFGGYHARGIHGKGFHSRGFHGKGFHSKSVHGSSFHRRGFYGHRFRNNRFIYKKGFHGRTFHGRGFKRF